MRSKKVKRVYAKSDEYIKVIRHHHKRKYTSYCQHQYSPSYGYTETSYTPVSKSDDVPWWLYAVFGITGVGLIILFWKIILTVLLAVATIAAIWYWRTAIWKSICWSAKKLWTFTAWTTASITKSICWAWNRLTKRKNTVDADFEDFPEIYN